MKTLIVDDDPIVREVLLEACQQIGFPADSACDGIEALHLLLTAPTPYDLLITDFRMPHMDGPKLLQTIQERKIILKKMVLFTCMPPSEIDSSRGPMEIMYWEKTIKSNELIRMLLNFLV